jgi:hypothetical protein
MFQTFRVMTVFQIGLMARNALRNESAEVRTEARKQLAGVIAMSGVLGGTLGVPFVKTALMVLSAAMGDDDEIVDLEADLYRTLEESFGESAAKAVTRGPASLLNMSLSERIALGDVFGTRIDPRPNAHGSALSSYLLTQAAGPAYSVFEGWVRAYDEIANNGEITKGLQHASPKPLKDLIKAIGVATDGLKDSSGKRLLKEEDIDLDTILLMAAGIYPEQIAEQTREAFRLNRIKSKLSERRGQLTREVMKAVRDGGDVAEALNNALAFSRANPRFPISGPDMTSAIKQATLRDLGVDSKMYWHVKEEFGL